MADYCVSSVHTGGLADGSTWNDSYANVAAALAARGPLGAGDRLLVDANHSDLAAGSGNITFVGLSDSVNGPKMMSVTVDTGDLAGQGFTALTAGATEGIATGANRAWNFDSGTLSCYGMHFIAGTSGGNAVNNLGSNITGEYNMLFVDCTFEQNANNVNAEPTIGPATGGNSDECIIHLVDPIFKGDNAGGEILLRNGRNIVEGFTFDATGVAPTTVFLCNNVSKIDVLFDACDFTGLTGWTNLIDTATECEGKVVFRNCKIPASKNLVVDNRVSPSSVRIEFYNVTSADENFDIHISDYVGVMDDETTIVASDGPSDGVTTLAWKIDTNAAALATARHPFRTPEIASRWNTTVGSTVTATIEGIWDKAGSVVPTDAEIWAEFMVLSTSGTPLGEWVRSDRVADVFGVATPASQSTSTVGWTTTGLTNPVKFALHADLTPQEAGVVIGRVCVGGQDIFYVSPRVILS